MIIQHITNNIYILSIYHNFYLTCCDNINDTSNKFSILFNIDIFQYRWKINLFTFQSLPQTPAGSAGGKASASGTGSSAGMVNGAGVDHENIRDGAGIDTELVSIQLDIFV